MKNKYQDLEFLLYKGFIPIKMKIGNINFVFKSINEDEYSLIRMVSGLESDPQYNIYFYINYLYYSIYMVDGMNILSSREENYSNFTSVLKQFPYSFFKIIFEDFEKLVTRQNECVKLIEPYSFKNESRYNWEFRKNSDLNSSTHTCIKGTEFLGLNQFQKYWAVLNLREDSNNSFEEKYNLAKFIASFTDSKAVRKIENRDKVKKEEEEKRKQRVSEIGTEDEKNYLSDPTDTAEGIIKELEKQMRGDKDAHDKYIDAYEKSIRSNMLKKMAEMKRIKDARRKQINIHGEESRAVSVEEMQEKIKRIQERRSNKENTEYISPDQKNKFHQMTNVDDADIIREEDFITSEDYNKLMQDDMFSGIGNELSEEQVKKIKKKEADISYKREQKKLAFQHGLDIEEDDLDFPHLRNK